MSTSGFFNSTFIQRLFKNRKESPSLIDSSSSKLTSEIISTIQSWINEDCLLNFVEINERLFEQFGVTISEDKLGCCFNSLHFSIEREPVFECMELDRSALVLLRRVFAKDFIKYSNLPAKLFFIGTTKILVHTRIHQSRKTGALWCVKSKSFVISAAFRSTKLYCYGIQEASKESPENSPEKSAVPVKFIDFFRHFTEKLDQDGLREAEIMIDGPCHRNLLDEDLKFVRSKKREHRITILPGDSSDFSPLEGLFDSLRRHILKVEPSDPQTVYNTLKRLPDYVTEIESSKYFSNAIKYIKIWSKLRS